MLLDNEYSHDQITRFLSGDEYTSRDLWVLVKPTVRDIETDDGALIFDDTIQEKPHSDENEIIAWHFDHCKNRTVKGVNILNCLYNVGDVNLPLAFEIVHKDVQYCEIETKKLKRKSSTTKNEYLRRMLRVCQQNQLRYRYVLTDNCFSAKENKVFIKVELEKDFVMALKSNRTVALSLEDKRQGRFVRVDALPLEENTVLQVYIKGLSFPVVLAKQVFTNKDGSIGILYLATSDLLLDYSRITTIYKKGGTSRSFINQSNPTPGWPTRRPIPSGRKATTFSRPSMRFTNLNYSRSSINLTISRSGANFTSKPYKPVSPSFNGSLRNISRLITNNAVTTARLKESVSMMFKSSSKSSTRRPARLTACPPKRNGNMPAVAAGKRRSIAVETTWTRWLGIPAIPAIQPIRLAAS